MDKPKKSLGQNFLIDKNIINKIVESVSIKGKHILEIGAGSGNLTDIIIKKSPHKITVVEKDKKLCEVLKTRFNKFNNIEIHNNDILNFDLENKIKKNTIIFGNLPYNIATKILINILKFKKWLPDYTYLVLMFQKEVAERILAKQNTKQYGRLSIIANYRLKIVNFFHISNNCFFPKPKVDSTVIIFKPFLKENDNYENFKKLEVITNIMFSNKRKMINKALKKLFRDENLISKKFNLDLKSRPSDVSKETFYNLIKFYDK